MTVSVLVVDDEPDLEVLFRQQFRRELRAQRFVMEFAGSAAQALNRISDSSEQTLILILSDINMPGATRSAARRSGDHDHRVRRCSNTQDGT